MIMSSLAELVRQRDELNRQIREADLDARQAWSEGLGRIAEAAGDYAEAAGVKVTESTRKNVVTMSLGGLVTVLLGYEEDEYSRWLEVASASGVHAVFGTHEVPPESAVVALVRELLLVQVPAS
jgi:hypothetical protein